MALTADLYEGTRVTQTALVHCIIYTKPDDKDDDEDNHDNDEDDDDSALC